MTTSQQYFNITHSEENRMYYKRHLDALVGPQAPSALLGGAVQQGPNLPQTYMQAHYKLTWQQMRDEFHKLFMDNRNDIAIIKYAQKIALLKTPVRTGKLVDHIMGTMKVDRTSWYKTSYHCNFSYDIPSDRTIPIKNPKHSPPDKGYGDWSGVKLFSGVPIPNVHKISTTMMGNALYELDDPDAEGDPTQYIDQAAKDAIIEDYAKKFSTVVVTAIL